MTQPLTILAVLWLTISSLLMAQDPPRLYLIAGHGSDHRVFQNLDFTGYDTVVLPFLIPERGEQMPAYARRMAARIDTTRPFALVGISIGGMIATEMADFLEPEAVVLIASAKERSDLPLRYRFQRHLPLYRLFPGQLLKRLTVLVQPWFEPGVRDYRELCRDMVMQKPPQLTRRGIHMIITWPRQAPPPGVPLLHLHGPEDTTLPLKCIEEAEVVPGGSHMMALFRGEAVSARMRAFLAAHLTPPAKQQPR